ncbi:MULTISPECIES: dihydrofolate reductase family protein [unclassified Microbacterium]|uniref:dihydrofolate reductase family protein n=1 Tax=Microbacterium TaxID=33882 RepID=UPI003B9FCB3A
MGVVFSSFTTSLDGFIADEHGRVGALFDWYENGDVEVPLRGYGLVFHMSQASADYWRQNDTEGAFVAGRGIFDDARGWGGRPPGDSPTVVVTHRPPPEGWPPVPDAPFTFVGDLDEGLRIARELAGDGDINVAGADIVRQCLDRGVLEEIRIDLAPVLLHAGTRYLDGIARRDIELTQLQVVEGTGVTHIRYAVAYRDAADAR